MPSPSSTITPRRSARNIKREPDDAPITNISSTNQPSTPPKRTLLKSPSSSTTSPYFPKPKSSLQSRKLAAYATLSQASPYPSFTHPTSEDCRRAHSILARLHGDRIQPDTVVAPRDSAGCGSSPSVLDALIRTILSQNTSDRNASRAKHAMDEVYGCFSSSSPSDRWSAIVEGGQPKLQRTIQSGGLSVVKSKVIINVLTQVREKHGSYSLDHLLEERDDAECMRQLLAFRGIGPKTASCVLLFCLQRHSFAVDTHVYRLTGLMGWRPLKATREEAHAHLDARIPDDEKYPLHVLLVTHGKTCAECKAGGKSIGKCELRKTFQKGVKDEVESKVDGKVDDEGLDIKTEEQQE
ncbi:hypothetical protein ACO1O0_003671 [Amphichorda felina]